MVVVPAVATPVSSNAPLVTVTAPATGKNVAAVALPAVVAVASTGVVVSTPR